MRQLRPQYHLGGGYHTDFDDLTLGVSPTHVVLPGTSSGDYEIRFGYVSAPNTLSRLPLDGLIGLLRRR